MLDGEFVIISIWFVGIIVVVEDDGDGFRVIVVNDLVISYVFNCGVVFCGNMLRFMVHSELMG